MAAPSGDASLWANFVVFQARHAGLLLHFGHLHVEHFKLL